MATLIASESVTAQSSKQTQLQRGSERMLGAIARADFLMSRARLVKVKEILSKLKSAKGRAFRGWLQAALMIYERVAISVWEEAVLSPLRGELLIDNLDNCIVITKASRAYAHTLALATNKTSKFSPISGLS